MEESEYVNLKNPVIKTNIFGFDNLFEERGLPNGISILISGDIGTGKSIFCRQISYNFLKRGGKCVYISFQESKKGIKRSMEKFGWNIDHFIDPCHPILAVLDH